MTWLDIVLAFLGAMASGDARAVKQLVSEDVEYLNDILELNGIDELLTIVGPEYKIQVKNWAYKNKLVFVEYVYWDYVHLFFRNVVGVYEIDNMGKICSIRVYE